MHKIIMVLRLQVNGHDIINFAPIIFANTTAHLRTIDVRYSAEPILMRSRVFSVLQSCNAWYHSSS